MTPNDLQAWCKSTGSMFRARESLMSSTGDRDAALVAFTLAMLAEPTVTAAEVLEDVDRRRTSEVAA